MPRVTCHRGADTIRKPKAQPLLWWELLYFQGALGYRVTRREGGNRFRRVLHVCAHDPLSGVGSARYFTGNRIETKSKLSQGASLCGMLRELLAKNMCISLDT